MDGKELIAYADFVLSRQIVSQICDKYQNLMDWLICFSWEVSLIYHVNCNCSENELSHDM